MKLNLLAVVPVTRTFFGKENHARVPLMSLRFDRHITHVRKDLAYGEWSLALR